MNYVDFHCHTDLSDGSFAVPELLRYAAEAQIQYLGVSDHNRLISDAEFKRWSNLAQKHKIILVPACEMSSGYISSDGNESEIHINCLFYRPGASPHLEKVAAYNRTNDQRGRVNKILDKLKCCGVDLHTSIEDLRRRYPQTHHIGRALIATEMVRQGYTCTKDEAFRNFLNDKTGKAYVKNDFTYAVLEDVLRAVREDQALAVLCHPLSYSNISDERELVKHFKKALDGMPGALECEYRRYASNQRKMAKKIAAEFDLLVSCGSDSHGEFPDELVNRFPESIYLNMLAAHKQFYADRRRDE